MSGYDKTLDLLKSTPLSQLNSEQMREARELAYDILRADYWSDVRSVAEEIKAECESGEIADDEALRERIHTECDGAGRVIYTRLAIETLLISDNESAYVDDFGTEGITDGETINWSQLAYSAYQADIQERLEAEGIGSNYFDQEDDDEADEDSDD
jgi:hypothetical protein